ncbi:MAG: hypothetical protein ACRDKV_07445 [Solirubrobacterales bacterium]
MRPRFLATLAATAAAALLWAAPAGADFQTFYDDYRADGVIDGCSHSPSVLSSALNDIPADIREYDPAFAEAINAALEQAATGCGTGPQDAATSEEAVVLAADGSPGPAPPSPPAIPATGGDRDMPAILVALVAVLGLALAAAALLGAAHRYGWDLRCRLAPVGGAVRGAERRLSGGLRSLLDRLGF